MAEYRLCTTWRIEAPLEDVYLTIRDAGGWPRWWHGVERVLELEPGDDSGVGRLQHYTWKGVLPYRLRFHLRVTRVEPQRVLEGLASGELEGSGRWSFESEHPVTTVRHEWYVRTTSRWMNLVAPLARPLFEWNHAAVMRRGAQGLSRVLGARLVSEQRGCADAGRAGTQGGRMPSQRRIDAHAAALAGLAAATVSTLVQVLVWWGVTAAFPQALWRDARLAAAIVMGSGVLPPPASFDVVVMLVASVVHLGLSIAYAAVLAPAIHRLAMPASLLAGAVFGLLLYAVNLYGFTALFPWFEQVRTWDTLLAHLAFGLVAAGVYRRLAEPGRPRP